MRTYFIKYMGASSYYATASRQPCSLSLQCTLSDLQVTLKSGNCPGYTNVPRWNVPRWTMRIKFRM